MPLRLSACSCLSRLFCSRVGMQQATADGKLHRAAAPPGPFNALVNKAALASSSLGSGITQYLGVGFAVDNGMTGMADTWSNAQAFCNVSSRRNGLSSGPTPVWYPAYERLSLDVNITNVSLPGNIYPCWATRLVRLCRTHSPASASVTTMLCCSWLCRAIRLQSARARLAVGLGEGGVAAGSWSRIWAGTRIGIVPSVEYAAPMHPSVLHPVDRGSVRACRR